MSRVRGKNTKPEFIVRRLLHHAGYRYRLHVPSLPGKPDIAFSRKRKLIFVHGCFWHGHDCHLGRRPLSNTSFWADKTVANQARDARNIEALQRAGWAIMVVWQCELRNLESVGKRLFHFLGPPSNSRSTTGKQPAMMPNR
jgi:DNA mismatch endonuclease, patch repair protein